MRSIITFFTVVAAGCAVFSSPIRPTVDERDTAITGPGAAYDLGVIYRGGIEVTLDVDKARTYFKQAAEDNHPPALTALGDLLQETAPLPKPYLEIASYYHEAALLGEPRAMFRMGRLASYVLPEKASIKSPFEWFLAAHRSGYADAAQEIGKIYEQRGDYKEAYFYYLKASDAGNSEAKLALSDFYTFGRGVSMNQEKGFVYLSEAAESGNVVACLNFGNRLKKKGLYFDLIEAGRWYATASQKKMKAARDTLEIERRQCLDRTVRVEERATSCVIAAATNDPAVLFTLSALLRADQPSPAHAREAHKWALKSAELGFEPARRLVMNDLKLGYGTPIDMVAYKGWESVRPSD